ncbi:Iron-sulfur assembly protein 1 [Sporothrix bragantina]|uniref:Iron-sulfur assembly protein 1 n=1 Tax=Sporothrix bragantina TaxID=671064 RepID=A0ABP0CSR9_9PEZI
MNSLVPQRSAKSACLFCRQTLVRQWRQQQQRQHSLLGCSTSNMSTASPALPSSSFSSLQPLFAPSQQRRRYLSGTAAAQSPPPFAQPVESSSTTASSTKTATTPYTRYSLYTEPVSPMTMRPPPPPTPVVDIDSPVKEQKAAPTSTSTATPTPTVASTPAPTATPAATTQKAATVEQLAAEQKKPSPAATTAAAAGTTAAPPAAPKKRSKLRTPRKAAMRLTPAAVEQVRELLEGPEPKLLKVGVRNRGCSGLAYDLQFVEKPGAFDEMVEQDGVRVLVDSKALFSIIGSEMDWVEDKLNQRFVFRNPNIKDECGCGESFMV